MVRGGEVVDLLLVVVEMTVVVVVVREWFWFRCEVVSDRRVSEDEKETLLVSCLDLEISL